MNTAGTRMVTRSWSRAPGVGPRGSGEEAAPLPRGKSAAGSATTRPGKGRRGEGGNCNGLRAGVPTALEGSALRGLGPWDPDVECGRPGGSKQVPGPLRSAGFPPSALFPGAHTTPTLVLNKDVLWGLSSLSWNLPLAPSSLWGRLALLA